MQRSARLATDELRQAAGPVCSRGVDGTGRWVAVTKQTPANRRPDRSLPPGPGTAFAVAQRRQEAKPREGIYKMLGERL